MGSQWTGNHTDSKMLALGMVLMGGTILDKGAEMEEQSPTAINIEVREGETVEQALARIAGIQPTPAPEKPKKAPKVTVSDPSTGDEIRPDVWLAIHVYQRDGEPDGIVRSNATYERKMRGPNILVFQHMHQYGAPCTPACREKVTK